MARRFFFTPSGRALIVVICSKTIYLRARRLPKARWFERLETFEGWVIGVYAESEDSLWLHSALAGGMLGKPTTGGLGQNLRRTRDAYVAYEVQWTGSGLRVALCDKDPAFEGGLGNLTEELNQWRRGEISTPPAITRVREIMAELPDVDAIMLPASPIESNAFRVALARVLLIRPGALKALEEPKSALELGSVWRLVLRLLRHRAPDRMASLEEPPGRKLWTLPRLLYFLTKRRVARAKDWLRRVLVEKPKESVASIREFLEDAPADSLTETITAVGYLARSLLEGWAAVLVALAGLIGALAKAGIL